MIKLDTIHSDLTALTSEELEKVQLAVNSEVGVRIQNERLARRIERAVIDAQAVGFNDSEISTIIEESKINARKGPVDPGKGKDAPREPPTRGPSAGTGHKTTK